MSVVILSLTADTHTPKLQEGTNDVSLLAIVSTALVSGIREALTGYFLNEF